MRISRLYIETPFNLNSPLVLDADTAHYVRSVLRTKKNTLITIFNGLGNEYQAEILEVSRKQVLIQPQKLIERSVESPLAIHLGLGISRGERMDFAIQKSVELGVNSINPLLTERCVVQLKGDKEQKKRHHWQKIAQHASEQSGRTIRPPIKTSEHLKKWLPEQTGLKVFLDPYAELSLSALTPEQNTVTLLAGPEGGFADTERELAKQADFIPVRLGKRILRTETAALAALTAVQVLWGDLDA